jgi:HD-GYP domain-containing protein (c-di-GMP phosphodiesterase class II)
MVPDDAAATDAVTAFEVHPRLLRPATFPPFNIYVRKPGNGKLLLFRKADEPVYANSWDKLEAHGFRTIYVRGDEQQSCYDYLEENLSAVLAEGAAPLSHVGPWAYRLACRAMQSMLEEPDSVRRYGRVEDLVSALVTIIRREPGIEWTMVDRAPPKYHTHAHSVNVCLMLAGLAAHSLGVEDSGLLREVALGAILHDIGKAMIAPEILEKPAALTRREFAQVKKHPREGLQIARPFLRRAAAAESIIFQHHENACGGGYPEGRSGEAINLFARAARVVDVFDAITSNRPYGPAADEYTALNTMVGEMKGQFDLAVLRKFIRYVGDQAEAPPVQVVEPAPEVEAEPEAPAAPLAAAAPAEPQQQTEETVRLVQAAPASSAEEDTSFLLQAVLNDAGLAARTQAEAAPEQAGELTVRPVIHLDPIEAEPHGESGGEPRAEALLGPSVEERLQAIRELGEARAGETALMSGLLGALKDALSGPLGRAAGASMRPAPESAAARSAREIEEAFVRSLFPLVWQIDEWIGRFSPLPHQAPETAAACADARSCLRALREDVIAVLKANNCEVIERDDGGPARVGFNYRGQSADEPLPPAPVVFYPESPKRKAG